MSRSLTRWSKSPIVVVVLALLLVAAGTFGYTAAKKSKKPDATGTLEASNPCLGNASGTIKLFKQGDVEKMIVSVQGLPPKTEFDVFVIQQPTPDFGMSWYQGDLTTDKNGSGSQQFLGRFSIETFIVAPNIETITVRPHPSGTFPDQSGGNPAIAPIHMFHVGLWFNSPNDVPQGCPTTKTPFNGDHTAGIQALRSKNENVNINGTLQPAGPLAQIQ